MKRTDNTAAGPRQRPNAAAHPDGPQPSPGDWLAARCRAIPDAVAGAIALDGPDGFLPAASWPAGSRISATMARTMHRALSLGSIVLEPATAGAEPAAGHEVPVDLLACPLGAAGSDAPLGVVVLALTVGPVERLAPTGAAIVAAADGLNLASKVRPAPGSTHAGLLLELVALVHEHDRLHAAASALATALAMRLGCTRVAVGFVESGRARVLALSHSARFERRSAALRRVGAAMDEAVDQRATVVEPAPDEAHVRPAHAIRELSAQPAVACACAVPLLAGSKASGAVLVETRSPLSGDDIELLEHLAALVAPVFELMRGNERSWLSRLADDVAGFVRRLFGRGRVPMKIVTVAVLGVALFLMLASGEYRVTADARIEGRIQRAVVAPVDGFIGSASVRAGDTVRAGDVLATLDDRDMIVEKRKLASEQDQAQREYRGALAAHDRGRASVLNARIDQVEARIALLDAQLERVRLAAPIDGIVVAGDLSQSLGSPVNRGDVLFEIAPLEDWRVVLEVDERDVGALQAGQRGTVRLSALPQQPLQLVVDSVTPVAHAEEGRNVYRVEALLDVAPPVLRPGMEGVSKIAAGERSLAWIWSHRAVDRVRLALWRWWP